jgi:hypothetical protein
VKLVKRIGCLLGRHYRSKGRAKLIDGTYFSRCAYCGVRMRQRGNKDWVVERER